MIYMICFCTALLLLILITAYGRVVERNIMLLIIAVTVGNGGYFALAMSRELNEAVLANKLTYVMGIFAPMIVFLIVCNICRVRLPDHVVACMYGVQSLIYLSVCSIGFSDIFYRSAVFHTDANGAYLTKTYGPMHTVYLIFLLLYTLAGIIVGLLSLNRKNVVSRVNVTILLFVDALVVGVYLVERFTHLNVELMPVVFTLATAIILIPLLKIYRYSVYSNQNILEDRLKKTGYIFFDKKLRYMGCSDYALALFPELSTWELEKKIPGNGGRFNTFLRQPLLAYIKQENPEAVENKAYEYKNEAYRYEISSMLSGKKKLTGYIIQVSNITAETDDTI